MRFLFCLLAAATLAPALVYTPRVVVGGQPDFYSLQTLAKSIVRPGMADREKAEAVWRFVLEYNFHYRSPREGFPGNMPDFEINVVKDALKLLNVYGYTYCYANIAIMQQLWTAVGLDSTRIWGIGGHLVAEVYYDGAWHHYDGDQSVSAYYIKDDGITIAGIDEIQRNPSKYIINPKYTSSPFLPYSNRPVYTHEAKKVLAGFFRSMRDNYIRDNQCNEYHKMDYFLRKNESLTLYTGKKGRWRHNGMDIARINPARGPYDAHGPRAYGNGLFEYRPDLSDTGVLHEGFYRSRNIRVNGGATLARTDTSGEFVIKVSSPYVICGTPMSPSTADTDEPSQYGAAKVSGRLNIRKRKGAVMEIQVRTAYAPEYRTVYEQKADGYFTVDLSESLRISAYYYFVRFVLKPGRDSAGLPPYIEGLALDTWVQLNPLTVPVLRGGVNQVGYSVQGPQVDKTDIRRCYNTEKALEFLYAFENIAVHKRVGLEYAQADTAAPGVMVFEMAAEEGGIYDFYLVALPAIREGMGAAFYYSENDTLHYRSIAYPEKKYHEHWAHWVSAHVPAQGRPERIFFKAVLTGGAGLTHVDYGYRYHFIPPSGEVSAVHGIEIDGKLKTFRRALKRKTGAYQIRITGKKIKNRFLRYECR